MESRIAVEENVSVFFREPDELSITGRGGLFNECVRLFDYYWCLCIHNILFRKKYYLIFIFSHPERMGVLFFTYESAKFDTHLHMLKHRFTFLKIFFEIFFNT